MIAALKFARQVVVSVGEKANGGKHYCADANDRTKGHVLPMAAEKGDELRRLMPNMGLPPTGVATDYTSYERRTQAV